MFNKNFYPTPAHVILMMGIDCYNKTVLEPQVGKGDLAEYLHQNGAKEVLGCEIHKDLAEIAKTKCKFIKHDFLKVTPEEISHIDLIVANPPFDHGDKHLLHMWNIAPDGCEIICLLNNATLSNSGWSSHRRELSTLIKDYGHSVNLGSVFSEAERETDVEVALVKLYKPRSGNDEFEGFFMDEEPEEIQGNGIMRYDSIRAVVQSYIGSVKCFEEHLVLNENMNRNTKLFGVEGFGFTISRENVVHTKEDFKKEIQKKAWRYLFGLMNLDKYLTTGVMKDINKFVENQTNVPFTMKNIYKMFDIIVGTRDQIFDKALVEAVDRFTMHEDKNRYNVEGWKTNSGHMLNMKFIVPRMVDPSYYKTAFSIQYSSYSDHMLDLLKVLCSITATNYSDIIRLDTLVRYQYHLVDKKGNYIDKVEGPYMNHYAYSDKLDEIKRTKELFEEQGVECEIIDQKCDFNTWYTWSFFEFKAFKKGTMHFKFKDPKVWEQLNRRYAKIKGEVLPEKFRV